MVDDTIVSDPYEKFSEWYSEAQAGKNVKGLKNHLISSIRRVASAFLPWANLFRPDVTTLATISPSNNPSARSVLFTGLVESGFSFFTDYESDKGKELDINPSAVMVFYWSLPPRQVRIDGKVRKLSREAAKKYWESRTRANQAASAAVTQSSIISSREELVEKTHQIEQMYKGKPIPCPDSWGGYTLLPEKIEFWEGKFDWLHDRERYILDNGHWSRITIAP